MDEIDAIAGSRDSGDFPQRSDQKADSPRVHTGFRETLPPINQKHQKNQTESHLKFFS